MSAQERLAVALDAANLLPTIGFSDPDEPSEYDLGDGHALINDGRQMLMVSAQTVLSADPHLAQDVADGEALRLLAAAAAGYALRLGKTPDGKWWFTVYEHGDSIEHDTLFGPIAEAADACRAALEGIRTVTVSRWLECPPPCGVVSHRSRTFTGPLADQDAEAWAPDPRCLTHLHAARRAEVGL